MPFFGSCLSSGPVDLSLTNDRSSLHNNHTQAVFDDEPVFVLSHSLWCILSRIEDNGSVYRLCTGTSEYANVDQH